MEKRFIIYLHQNSAIEGLYSLSFNHYWNIHYDTSEEVFSYCEGNVFDSKDYFNEDWDIEEDDFLDFLTSISTRIYHECFIGYYQKEDEMIGYLKLPDQPIFTFVGKMQSFNTIQEMVDHFQIQLTKKDLESIQYIMEEL